MGLIMQLFGGQRWYSCDEEAGDGGITAFRSTHLDYSCQDAGFHVIPMVHAKVFLRRLLSFCLQTLSGLP